MNNALELESSTVSKTKAKLEAEQKAKKEKAEKELKAAEQKLRDI